VECDLKMESIIEYAHYIAFQLLRRQTLENPLLLDVLLDVLASILCFVLKLVGVGAVLLLGLTTLNLLLLFLPFLELVSVTTAVGFCRPI